MGCLLGIMWNGVVINSNADPSLAHKGKASVTMLMGANYYDFPEKI